MSIFNPFDPFSNDSNKPIQFCRNPLEEFVKGVGEDIKKEVIKTVKSIDRETGENLEKFDRGITTVQNPTKIFDPNPIKPLFLIIGDHIKVTRSGFQHHGLYSGNQKVIHYDKGYIHEITLDEFSNSFELLMENTAKTYSDEEIIKRARSRMGESLYDVFQNNCEHFVKWCRSGN